MRYEYRLQDSSIVFTGRTSISFSLKSTSNIRLTSITLFGVKSSYMIGDDVQEVTLQCNLSSDTNTVESDTDDITFSCNQEYTLASNIYVNISISGNGSFELPNGIDAPTVIPTDGAAGIINTSTSSIPHFAVDYTVLDEPFLHNSAINDGYFYINGLLTDYGDYVTPVDWYIDTSKNINAGYPFLEGLLTDYGDYAADSDKILMYRNNIRLKAYKNSVEIMPQKQGV